MNFREANEEFIVTQMNRFASYINHLCEFVKLYKKEYEELCIRNNKNPNTLAKDKSIIEYERGMKESYDTALDIYNYLKDLRDRNREGENVQIDLHLYNAKIKDLHLPIRDKVKIMLIPKDANVEDYVSEYETGGAVKISEQNVDEPTIAGVKKGNPMSFYDAGNGKVNPKYDRGGGYHRNCQVCVAVFIARMRGYNVEALPFNEKNKYMMKLRRDPRLAFIDRETGEPPKEIVYPSNDIDYPNMLNWLNAVVKKDEIYGLICKVTPTKDGQDLYDHIILVSKLGDGKDSIIFYDPQNNYSYSANELIMIRFANEHIAGIKEIFQPHIFRLDNCDLNIEYLNEVSRKSKRF